MDKIFITGATGYIGSRLAHRLAMDGHTVHALCRSLPGTQYLDHPKIRVFRGNILNKEPVKKAMFSCNKVYHLAAHVSTWAKNPNTYDQINVKGTEIILETALKQGIEKAVVTSTAGVLGPALQNTVSEQTSININYITDYSRSKAAADRLVKLYVDKGLDTVIVYPTRVFGPGLPTESNFITKIIKLYTQNKWHIIPGNGRSIANYTYIDDLVEGHILAMKSGRKGEKYILGGNNLSYNDFFRSLSISSGKKYRLIRVPKGVMMSYALYQELLAKSFKRKPLITRKWVIKSLHNWILTSEKAEQELQYKITPFEEAINQTLHWLEKNDIQIHQLKKINHYAKNNIL